MVARASDERLEVAQLRLARFWVEREAAEKLDFGVASVRNIVDAESRQRDFPAHGRRYIRCLAALLVAGLMVPPRVRAEELFQVQAEDRVRIQQEQPGHDPHEAESGWVGRTEEEPADGPQETGPLVGHGRPFSTGRSDPA